jgi:hypothetical protein
MTKARASDVPAFSALRESLRTAYFYDCYTVELPPDDRSPLELYLSVASKTPRWIEFLMNVRNSFVAQLGLKNVGAFGNIEQGKSAHAYRVGDQAGIFKLLEIHEHEVVLGETDRHLDVKISVAKQSKAGGTTVYVSTVVHVHNAMGRLYMLFVTPAHRIIAPASISKVTPQPV